MAPESIEGRFAAGVVSAGGAVVKASLVQAINQLIEAVSDDTEDTPYGAVVTTAHEPPNPALVWGSVLNASRRVERVLMDVLMPPVSGKTMLDAIRWPDDIHLIITSANLDHAESACRQLVQGYSSPAAAAHDVLLLLTPSTLQDMWSQQLIKSLPLERCLLWVSARPAAGSADAPDAPDADTLEWRRWFVPQGPTPLGHAPEPEPVVDGRWLDPAEHGLAGWVAEMSQRPTSWSWRDGTIVCAPGKNEYGWLRAPIEVEDFLLQVEWKVPKGGNTGIFLRARPVTWDIPPGVEAKAEVATLGADWPSRTGLELQAQDDPGHADKYSSGSLYRHAAPAENPIKPAGQWNRYTVRCRGMRVEVWSNGAQVLDTTIDHFPMLRQPPRRGFIGLQNHGVGAEFRNVRLLRLEPGA